MNTNPPQVVLDVYQNEMHDQLEDLSHLDTSSPRFGGRMVEITDLKPGDMLVDWVTGAVNEIVSIEPSEGDCFGFNPQPDAMRIVCVGIEYAWCSRANRYEIL